MKYLLIPLVAVTLVMYISSLAKPNPRNDINKFLLFVAGVTPVIAILLFMFPSMTLSETDIVPYFDLAEMHPLMFLVPLAYAVVGILSLINLQKFYKLSGFLLLSSYVGFWFMGASYSNLDVSIKSPAISFILVSVGQAVLPLIALLCHLWVVAQKTWGKR